MSQLTALALVCTLKPSPADSSSALLASQILGELEDLGTTVSAVRVVDFDVQPGVESDMGDGDEWPSIREKVLAADILVVVTPTWMGQLSSVGQRVLERLDAELAVTGDNDLPILFNKVAVVGIVGNEDGAHHIASQLFQGLNDVGFTIPAQGSTYWNGEAMHGTDYKDLSETPEVTSTTTHNVAVAAVHLATALKSSPYPAR